LEPGLGTFITVFGSVSNLFPKFGTDFGLGSEEKMFPVLVRAPILVIFKDNFVF